MQSIAKTAVGYLRTSSQINSGDKGSQARQRAAIKAFAKANSLTVVDWFYDEGVSGAVPIKDREQFGAMLDRLYGNGCKVVLIESVSRLARDIETKNGTSITYEVHAAMRGGKKEKFLSGLADTEQALFIEQELEPTVNLI